jgi:ribosomal protein S18 acetylase RimI-like enzyme
MGYGVRESRMTDWRRYRALRLAALRDPMAPVAFFEPYEDAVRRTPEGWQRQAESLKERTTFAGEAADGSWAGMVTGILHDDGHVHIVGVYVAPEHRGAGLAEALMRAAVAWAGDREVRLDVHENNERAARFYRRLGFRPTGHFEPDPHDPRLRAWELTLRRPTSSSAGQDRSESESESD